MGLFRRDPGACIICGAPHCACGGGPIEVPQLPQRDAAIALARASGPALEAERVQGTLPPGTFTSGTYRGTGKKPRR